MQNQQQFWVKTIIAGALVVGVIYLISQPGETLTVDNSDPVVITQAPSPVPDERANSAPTPAPATTFAAASSNANETLSPELQERIAAIKQRRPNQQFNSADIAAAVERTTSWTPTEEIPRDLPLQPEEFTDGRQFIELDSLKIETLMPGDKVEVQVDPSIKEYEVTIDRVEKHDYNSISWYGHIQGDDGQKYNVSFTRGEQLTVGGVDTPDGHYVVQGHGEKGWVASSQLLFKADPSVSDAIHPSEVDPHYPAAE